MRNTWVGELLCELEKRWTWKPDTFSMSTRGEKHVLTCFAAK